MESAPPLLGYADPARQLGVRILSVGEATLVILPHAKRTKSPILILMGGYCLAMFVVPWCLITPGFVWLGLALALAPIVTAIAFFLVNSTRHEAFGIFSERVKHGSVRRNGRWPLWVGDWPRARVVEVRKNRFANTLMVRIAGLDMLDLRISRRPEVTDAVAGLLREELGISG
jgi:hypothetical protein